MYLPTHFKETEAEEIGRLLLANPLATIVHMGEGGLDADAIPLLRNGDRLIGHIAAGNRMHEMKGDEVLAVFHGRDAYVSPTWYPSKAEHLRVVPTWNYQMVQVHGQVTFHHDAANKRRIIAKLNHHFETQTNGELAWKMGDAPRDFMDAQLAGIVGFDISIDKITAKSKLSQNKSKADHENVAREMRERGEVELADVMTGKIIR